MGDSICSRLPRAFFERAPEEVAVDLLGASVISAAPDGLASGRVVEVEAYGDASDLASHAARLKDGGVRSMTGPAGIAYVYRSYGIHAMLNVIAKSNGGTGAVLIRALEPIEGIELMRERRGVEDVLRLCSGPGKLCQALGIGLELHGTDLTESSWLWLAPGQRPVGVVSGERIGIRRSVEIPWRFFEADSAYVSGHRRGMSIAPSDPANEKP